MKTAIQPDYYSQVELILSATDGFYYAKGLPKGHTEDKTVAMSVQDASIQLNKTIEYLKGKML